MKKYLFFIVILVNFGVLLWVYGPQVDGARSYLGIPFSTNTLDSHIGQRMDELNIHGLSLALINQGEVVYSSGYGLANVEKQLPVTQQTIFEGASLSKPVFAFFVMTFVEEGRLDLDKPLHEYYPHPDISDPSAEAITARMVLSHQSGFPNWRENEPDEILKINFKPGTDYLYSGEGYQYLAMVLREIEQTDWAGLEQIFQARVAQPLGLNHTVFIQTPYTRQHKAEPYDAAGQWIDWANSYTFQKEDGNFYAPSSIHSEPEDFSKWMIGIMNEAVLSEASYAELLKPHSSVPDSELPLSNTLGFFTVQVPLTEFYLHSGNNNGFDGWFALDVNRDWGFVMFANSDNGEAFGEELFLYLLTGPSVVKPLSILGLIVLNSLVFGIGGIRALRNQLPNT
ncbi:MAG: serine hydrolase domain-containing protein [Chloroflexota bacterium]